MSDGEKRKQSLYFPDTMLKEIMVEATRQDRSLSWVVQKAWKAARRTIMASPGAPTAERAVDEVAGQSNDRGKG
jgi:uncharacterized small protein (TIGR04563 family)